MEREDAAEPEATAEPPASSAPEAPVQPSAPSTTAEIDGPTQPDSAPEPDTAPETKAAPAPQASPEPKAAPAPQASPEPKAGPEPKAAPEPSAAPGPNASPQPKAAPEPNATPEPNASPQPKASDPQPAPEPDTPTKPTAAPTPDAPVRPPAVAEPGATRSPARGSAAVRVTASAKVAPPTEPTDQHKAAPPVKAAAEVKPTPPAGTAAQTPASQSTAAPQSIPPVRSTAPTTENPAPQGSATPAGPSAATTATPPAGSAAGTTPPAQAAETATTPPAQAKVTAPSSPAPAARPQSRTPPIALPPAATPTPTPEQKPARQSDGKPGPTPAPAQPAATVTTPEQAKPGLKPTGRQVLLLAVLVLLVAGVTVQLRRTPPPARVTINVASTYRIPGAAPQLPWPRTGSAELMVEGLGRLGGVNATKPAPIGSVAKVMTAYLILRDHPLGADDPGPMLTVSAADVQDYQARIPDGQSLVKVRTGERISERQALEALLLPSANNVAHMLAVWDAGSAGAFVARMNRAAAELGMTGTTYTDPSGFLPTTVSTAADQVVLGRAALQDEVFAGIIAERSATIPVAGKIKNYNALLGRDGVFGIKTGSTTQAGGNLVFASRLKLNGQVLTVVGAVFNQPGDGTPEQLARVNKIVHRLLTAVRAAVRSYTILPAQPLGKVRTAWGKEVTVSAASVLKTAGWPGLRIPVTVTTSAPGASVRSGQTVGAAEAVRGPSGVRVELRADRATGGPPLWWRLIRLR